MHYSYIAVNLKGKKIKGILNAIDKNDAITQLKDKGMTAVSLDMQDAGEIKNIWSMELGTSNIHKMKMNKKKLLAMLNQLGIMMKAGVSLSISMDVLINTEKSKKIKGILHEMNDDLYAGIPLSQSMEKFASFPNVIVNIVRSGEANGRLDIAFERCAIIIEKEIALSSKIKGALAYPAFLLVLTLGLVIIMSAVVLPTFVDIFLSYDVELPPLTVFVMAFSDFLVKQWVLVLGGIIFLVALFILLKKNVKPFALFLSKLLLKLPLIGKLMRQSYIARFCRIMSSLVEAGVNIVEALEIASTVLPNLYMREQLSLVVEDVKIGSAIHQSMAKYPIFDSLLVSMVEVGEESGMLFETLSKMSDLYEQQTDEAAKQFTTMLEPAMTIVIAVVVGMVIISIVLPMFGMYDVLSGAGTA